LAGTGVEVLAELWEGLFLKVLGENLQECITKKRQIGQQIGLAGAGTIFSHQRVAPPVIADFNPTPVSADQIQPPLGLIFFGRRTG
jgi:hypothetical protein